MISPCSVLAPRICLVLALGSSAVSIQAAEEAEAKQALDQIVQKLNALEEWFTDAQQRSASIQQQIQRQDQTIAQLRRQSRQLEASISEIEHEVAQLQKQRRSLSRADTATAPDYCCPCAGGVAFKCPRLYQAAAQPTLKRRRPALHALSRLL